MGSSVRVAGGIDTWPEIGDRLLAAILVNLEIGRRESADRPIASIGHHRVDLDELDAGAKHGLLLLSCEDSHRGKRGGHAREKSQALE